MRRVVFGLVVVFLSAGGMAAVGCSGLHLGGDSTGGTGVVGGPIGQIGFVRAQLTLSGGEHISSVSYILTNGTNSYNGTEGVSVATTVSFVIPNVAAGSGYVLTLHAVSDDAIVSCNATSVPFSVANRVTTLVNVNAVCVARGDGGGAMINAVTSNCPAWNTIVANPSTASVSPPNNTMQLTAGAEAPDPGLLAFNWSVSAGTLSSAAGMVGPNTNDAGAVNLNTFTCPPTPGPVTITLVTSDGPLPEGGGCPSYLTTGSITVQCQSAVCAFGTGCGDGGQVCNSAGQCVPALFSVLVLSSLDGGTLDESSVMLPISIQDFNLSAAVGTPIQLPSQLPSSEGGAAPITLTSNHTTAGDLTTSTDGRYLSLIGFQAAAGGTTQTGLPVVARIGIDGGVDTTTVPSNVFQESTNPPIDYRSAVSSDGNEFWVSGVSSDKAPSTTTGGIWYVPFGAASGTQLAPFPNPVAAVDPLAANADWGVSSRWLRIFGGQLYAGTDYSRPYLVSVGSGLPTSAISTASTPYLPTLAGGPSNWTGPVPSPFGFVMFSLFSGGMQPDTLYVADDGMNLRGSGDLVDPPSTTDGFDTGGGGLTKWVFNALNGWTKMWTMTAGTFPADAGPDAAGSVNNMPIGFRGVAGFATGTTVTLVATTANGTGNPNTLVVMQDPSGSASPPSFTAVATAPASQVFRGVALTPQ
jgi:hypothetical protein